jgi:hypothetical protein
MRRLGPGLAVVLALVSLALLSAATPSWAHTGPAARLSDAAAAQMVDAPPAPDGVLRQLTLSAAPETLGIPWPALFGALIVIALGWRRPRRALIFAVVLLLAVFAFEDGLHSVHHLVDRSKLNKCAVAVAAAHLNATAVDEGGTVDVIVPVIAVLTEVGQTDPVTSFLSPVQGRAPPTPAG